MAQHRTARTTHRVRNTMLGVGAFLGVMYAVGHNAQVDQAQAITQPAYVVSTPTITVTSTAAEVTETAAQETSTVSEDPEPVTVTSTAAPATVTSTEYPADVVVTEYPDHATVTSTAPQQTITEVVRPAPAHKSLSASDLPTCANEDGSGGSEFPCKWDPAVDGNGQGSGGIQVFNGPDEQ